MSPQDFRFSNEPEPHKQRTRAILTSHPEVRELIGKNPTTFLAILFCVGSMVALAWLVRDAAWYWVLLLAYFVGAFFNHSLFVLIHECSHNLLFKKKSWNYLASILANLPHGLPSAVSFTRYHIIHHSHQGEFLWDADLPGRKEAAWFGNNPFSKALWLLLFPFFQLFRTFRLKHIRPLDGWIVTNWIVQFAFDAFIWIVFGPQALLFLLLSFFFSVGLHPLGARWIQEHYLTLDPVQETYSYYGPLNTIAFNVGYHNEHHDLPSVPWNRLPELRKRAPEFYNTLKAHRSWTLLFFRFLFDPSITLHSRMLRADRTPVQD